MDDSLNDGKVLVYRCRRCGVDRTCRRGWRTRCHICPDERSTPALEVLQKGGALLQALRHDPEQKALILRQLDLPGRAKLSAAALAAHLAALTLNDELDRYRRSGWTEIVTDVHGLPWLGERLGDSSHGTSGVHRRCGTRQRLRIGAIDCPECGPEAGSRTHAAKADDPYLLYLVRFGREQKFGVGDDRRVREHLRAGARLLQVLTSRHADVVKAERMIKQIHRPVSMHSRKANRPRSFGKGTEVIPAKIRIDLHDVLHDGDDVRHRFAQFG